MRLLAADILGRLETVALLVIIVTSRFRIVIVGAKMMIVRSQILTRLSRNVFNMTIYTKLLQFTKCPILI